MTLFWTKWKHKKVTCRLTFSGTWERKEQLTELEKKVWAVQSRKKNQFQILRGWRQGGKGNPMKKEIRVYLGIAQTLIRPPFCAFSGTLWHVFFTENIKTFLIQRFWLRESIFWKWLWSNTIQLWYSDGNHDRYWCNRMKFSYLRHGLFTEELPQTI